MSMILVAVDLEFDASGGCHVRTESQEALGQAIRFGRALGHGLRLAHAGQSAGPDDEGADMRLRRMILDQWVAAIRASGLPAEWVYLHGDPGEELVTLTHELEPPLLVVGTRQRSDGSGRVISSIAGRLLAEVRVPLCIVRHEAASKGGALIASDLSPGGAVLEGGLHLANSLGLQARILHVLREGEAEAQALASIRELVADPSRPEPWPAIAAEDCLFRRGDLHASLLHEVRDLRPEFLIMGSAGRQGLASLIKSNSAEDVWRDISCSLYTVPTEPS